MRVHEAYGQGRPVFSFEFFPPKTDEAARKLMTTVADLREQTLQLKRDNAMLTTRFALGEQQGNAVQKRVGALEVSLPRLLEALPAGAQIDRSSLTASVGEALVYDADGGSVMIRQQPMPEAAPANQQPLPQTLQSATTAPPTTVGYGIALGSSLPAEQASAAWNDLSMKLGPLLFGLTPLLVDQADSQNKRLVVGPIAALSEATALCARLERISIACMPMPFTGTPLSQ